MNLQMDWTTWAAFFVSVLLWAGSAVLVRRRVHGVNFGVKSFSMSLFPYAWVGFGL
jgi:hypothetical protein